MIRPLNENDLDEFIKIRSDSLIMNPKSFGAMPGVNMDRTQTTQDLKEKDEENFILGYFIDGILVGSLGFIRYKREKTKHKGFIWGVFVYSSYRGQQIGQQLLKGCIDKASKIEGLKKIILSVSHTSQSAIHLYEKLGFRQYGRELESMIWDGESIDEIFMEKKI